MAALRKAAKTTDKKIDVRFDRWKKAVQRIVTDDFGHSDIWDENDPYDLASEAETSFRSGSTPRSFVDEMFSEDRVRKDHDDMLAIESDMDDGYGQEWS